MLESVIGKLPELQKLESTVAALERAHGEASARVQALAHRTAQARETDLNAEAAALNAGRKPPNPTEPRLAEQLADAGRDAEVLQRRLALAQGDRARYISEHHAEIAALLGEAHAEESQLVAAAAEEALAGLLRRFEAEDAARNLQRLHPAPAAENVSGPESMVTVWGSLTTNNLGGENRGALEGVLRQLIGMGEATIVEVGAEDDENAA
jgi:multidrug efflux pump subunit AcrA (membrane-fusion protein)